MTKYTVRVLLHETEEESDKYDILHKAMEEAGFQNTIIGRNGVVYKLPRAEYNIITNDTPKNIRTIACKAAKLTKKEYAILVTPSNCRYWRGLKPVEEINN